MDLGTCKLCKTGGVPIHDSHIVPAWAFKRVLSSSPERKLVKIQRGAAVYDSRQWSEYMLCGRCEKLFKTWEDVLADLLIQEDGSFPALEAAKLNGITSQVGAFAEMSAPHADAILRFCLSVIWRVSASTEHFPKLTLGPYHDRLGHFLLADFSPVPDYVVVPVEFMKFPASTPGLEYFLSSPAVEKQLGGLRYSMSICGMWLRVYVGGTLVPTSKERCVGRKRIVLISDGSQFLAQTMGTMKGAKRKGVFAKEPW